MERFVCQTETTTHRGRYREAGPRKLYFNRAQKKDPTVLSPLRTSRHCSGTRISLYATLKASARAHSRCTMRKTSHLQAFFFLLFSLPSELFPNQIKKETGFPLASPFLRCNSCRGIPPRNDWLRILHSSDPPNRGKHFFACVCVFAFSRCTVKFALIESISRLLAHTV